MYNINVAGCIFTRYVFTFRARRKTHRGDDPPRLSSRTKCIFTTASAGTYAEIVEQRASVFTGRYETFGDLSGRFITAAAAVFALDVRAKRVIGTFSAPTCRWKGTTACVPHTIFERAWMCSRTYIVPNAARTILWLSYAHSGGKPILMKDWNWKIGADYGRRVNRSRTPRSILSIRVQFVLMHVRGLTVIEWIAVTARLTRSFSTAIRSKLTPSSDFTVSISAWFVRSHVSIIFIDYSRLPQSPRLGVLLYFSPVYISRAL